MPTQELILVRRLQRREPAALGDLYDRFGMPVYRLLLRMVRNAAVAEDLTQETFLSIWNGIETFDPAKGTLGRWVGVVARSRAIDYLRTAEFRACLRSSPVEAAERLRPTAGASAQVERAELLREPWSRLKRHEQNVLRLAHWFGFSQSEIAEQMQCPLGTIKSWMRSGHRTLRAALEG